MRHLHIGRMVGSAARLLAAAVLCLALGAVQARADFVFTLSDVTFNDGTEATGTFTTSDDLMTLLDYDIATQSNGVIPAFEYTPASSTFTSTALPFIIVLNVAPDRVLQLTFDGGLTSAGAPILAGPFNNFDSFEQSEPNVQRFVTGGFVVGVTAVPEPSSLLMGGMAGLSGLGLWARRRRAG